MNQPNDTPTLDGSFPRKGLGNPTHLGNFPNGTLETIFTRRTIRRFTDEPIAPELLDMIVDAGLRAPNGGGCQSVLGPWRQLQGPPSRKIARKAKKRTG